MGIVASLFGSTQIFGLIINSRILLRNGVKI